MAKGSADVYTQAVYTNLHPLHGNWEPSQPVALGDFGLLSGKIFNRQGNIAKKFKIKFNEISAGGKDRRWFCSDEDHEVTSHAKGTYKIGGVANARAMLEMKFTQSDAVFFNAAGCSYSLIDDKVALGEAIMSLYSKKSRSWNKKWVVVTDVIRAKSTTVIITSGKSGNAMLEATGNVEKIDLADASIGFKMGNRKSVGYHVEAEKDRSPLFALSGIQPRFLWFFPEFGPKLTAKESLKVTAELAAASPVWTRKSSDDWIFAQVL